MREKVEEAVIKEFGFSREDVLGKNNKREPSIARGILFTILHYDMGKSANEISKMYDRSIRCVFKLISKVVFLTKHNHKYKEKHKKILNSVIENKI